MASQNREFVAVFNVDSGKDKNSIYDFSLFEARANLGDSIVQKNGVDIAENATSLQPSSEMEASETKKKNRTKKGAADKSEGHDHKLEKMSAMSKEWEAFLRSIASGDGQPVDV